MMTIDTEQKETPAQRMQRRYGTPLTEREHQVLLLIARGMSNAQVAHTMYLSEDTVKTHVRYAQAKLGAAHRTQMVVYALAHGLVEVALRVRPDLEGRPRACVVVLPGTARAVTSL